MILILYVLIGKLVNGGHPSEVIILMLSYIHAEGVPTADGMETLWPVPSNDDRVIIGEMPPAEHV
jgi:hypothetical protein